MAEGVQEQPRTIRLPVSGDVVQWLPDGRWRMVARAQFETEQARSPRLPVAWIEPDDSPNGISGQSNHATDERVPPWWRIDGMVTDEKVEARYPDGSEAPVIIAGPVWVIEGLISLGKPYVAVGEPMDEAIRRQQAYDAIMNGKPSARTGGKGLGWIGAPPPSERPESATEDNAQTSEAPPADEPDPEVQQGVAWLAWTHSAHDYCCSLQPFAGQRLPSEDAPDVASLDEALAWARARTSHILVRPEWDPNHHYIATDAPPAKWKRLR